MNTQQFHTTVRGHTFVGDVAKSMTRPGQRVVVRVEDTNPVDTYAVELGVVSDTREFLRIGYLERPVAVRVRDILSRGGEVLATLAGWWPEPEGRWRRPVVQLRLTCQS